MEYRDLLSKVEEHPMKERETGRYRGEEKRVERKAEQSRKEKERGKEGKKYTNLLRAV